MTWKDQPDERENATLVIPIKIYDKGSIGELWRINQGGEWEWFVTVGNLFGSQTVKCKTIESAAEVIRLINVGRTSWRDLPMGTQLLETAKQEAV